ncbi:MAG TPA: polyribonucleotide nucleotidyltransferase [Verrucomicrobia bacterium]|nr:MAG: polyribonucleotide nucleotidyltransferase [Lentisphaerae bacterium GWF2_57_35]HBA83700.1 polyribonucleotide nucleotidyltransferase [Verrucomicrobiota bacterium]
MKINNTKTVEVDLSGKKLRFETGVLARQAHGAVTVQLGETIVFSAVTASEKPREGIDFFPLQVEYREKFYAAGKFPGGYFKREGRPSEKEILTARVTDRPIRPLFPEGFYNEVQINNTLICADGENESDVLCINAASAALTISEIPFYGPIGAVRVGRVNGQFVVNPTHTDMKTSDLDLIYVGTRELPMMIEGSAHEISETDMLAAMKFGHESIQKLIDAQLELRKMLGLSEKVITAKPIDAVLVDKARELVGAELAEALLIPGKQERQGKVKALRTALDAKMTELYPDVMKPVLFSQLFDKIEIEVVRKNVLEKSRRIDGRGFDDLRPLDIQVGLFPRTHGSALFSRGETQAMTIATLGTTGDAQEMDGITGGPEEKNFILHYNFPPYSTGEVGRLGGTGRREIGHGALAERSIAQMMPKDYPYTVRLVSEIMGSNGSSSMASVCAGTLALMDAGIPLIKPVAGISIGLFTGDDKAVLVTDILGSEDHCGDMDFKVAGTKDGITGFQVDLKLRGLKWELVEGAFIKARTTRIKILDAMTSVIAQPRPDLSQYAPRIQVVKINPEKIGALIGPGGKNIRRITETTGAQIDIDDDGTVHIFSNDKDAMDAAVREVNLITAEAEVGKIYRGTVTGIKDFGAFVEIIPGREGLVHISELANFRVNRVEDVVKMGEAIWVKCLNVDENGKVRLSRKAALEEKDLKE